MRGTRPAFSVGEIVRATGGSLEVGKTDARAFGVSTDSRTVEAGNLFVALRGDRFDGHDFLAKAAEKKAAGFVVKAGTRLAGAACGGEDLFVVAVADTLRALGDLARHWRDHFELPVIAVTGSSGKTTTKDMIGAVLSRGRKSLVSPGNWNNLVGVPKALFGIREDHEAAVIEMGTNRMGEIGRLAEIARPTVGVITTIGRAHLEGFGTLDRVAEEKGSLFRGMDPAGTIVVNEDDARILKAAAPWGGKRITFGVHGQADVGAEDMVIDSTGGTRFTLRVGS
ncbi:MAG TPA: UDP-N-acetylmuramoyl-tripeptide--D-alanyl-D-alanine ligase, partial [Syntrophales bacterium]|nr:UDP-N-acetylmuramoyl-tripeptide--D-alanyl-D-alanine ligase [Syntrophales bacterium]